MSKEKKGKILSGLKPILGLFVVLIISIVLKVLEYAIKIGGVLLAIYLIYLLLKHLGVL